MKDKEQARFAMIFLLIVWSGIFFLGLGFWATSPQPPSVPAYEDHQPRPQMEHTFLGPIQTRGNVVDDDDELEPAVVNVDCAMFQTEEDDAVWVLCTDNRKAFVRNFEDATDEQLEGIYILPAVLFLGGKGI